MMPEFGPTPCQRCNEHTTPLCRGFDEWPIHEMPAPGSFTAIDVFSCTCSAQSGYLPRYAADCSLHVWVCQKKDVCLHTSSDVGTSAEAYSAYSAYSDMYDHRGVHTACEHCTIPHIECSGCGQRWMDWRTQPAMSGWEGRYDLDGQMTWRCGTCVQAI